MVRIIFVIFCFSCFWVSRASDLSISSVFQPASSSCDMDQEVLTVYLSNQSGVPFFGNFEMGYILNSGSAVTQNTSISSMTPLNSTIAYTFPNLVDLSNCQIHTLKIWVHESSDTDNSNDTLLFQVTNDCSSGLAYISLSDSCYTNGDSLFLFDFNGVISSWDESNDGGLNWSSTSTSNNGFLPINWTPILIRSVISSQYGICLNDTVTISLPTDDFLIGVDAGNDTSVFIHDTIQLNGSGGSVFSWTPNLNVSNSTIYNPQVWPEVSTMYFLESSQGTCMGIDSVMITVIDNSNTQIYANHNLTITNTITQQSPSWEIFGLEKFPENKVFVYNLKGQVVYSAHPYDNGLNVDLLGSGTYIYQINLNSKSESINGKLIVVK